MDGARPGEPDQLLPARLAAATDVQEACEAATEELAADGLLVSVYLQQGDRLRCRSVQGYWQIFDGMSQAGVIGTTFRTGRRALIRGAQASPDYLAAAPDVVDELCVPLRRDGLVVGALNVETTDRLTAAQEARVDQVCALLEQRLAGFPPPAESPAQKLGRQAAELTRLAATVAPAVLPDAVVRAAVDISGMDSAALCLEADEALAVQAATGPLAERFRTLPPEQLARIAAWVETGTSSYTVGAVAGLGFPGHEELRSYGAGSLMVLPLGAAGGRRGMLVVLTADVLRLRADEVELLELLASSVDSCLLIADSVVALRRRAEADALTGLGHHASFHATLPPARRSGASGRLAVLYVDVDHFKSVNDTEGHAAGDRLLLAIADRMRGALREQDRLFRIGGDEFAALAHVDTPEQALALGTRLLDGVVSSTGATLSIGVAVEEPEESDAALLARADAAVYAAKALGRATVQLAPSRLTGVPVPRST